MTALEFANKHDFEDVEKAKPFNGKKCWAVVYRKPKSIHDEYYIGFPQYIIKDRSKFRFLTYEEAMDHVSYEEE